MAFKIESTAAKQIWFHTRSISKIRQVACTCSISGRAYTEPKREPDGRMSRGGKALNCLLDCSLLSSAQARSCELSVPIQLTSQRRQSR